ncbi:methyltransferase domain-containing protein [Peptostreptococcus porci]|uniref:methyltransferase domain-containing protein n=1 Tax=Peptostreptococcus porci TaxID=2652282 RepID=UPI0023F3E9E9|nr:methyltransferase domain-containing protein [Peptostreptococcus porci]MDD7183785.1 methyltransferase domain-containing protein [Peptostreptococcus porci]MDY5964655.1 methyltransferase domain-containing protein [Peptostreptococcus porci]
MEKNEIKTVVTEFYSKIAKGSNNSEKDDVSKSIGYSQEDLNSIPNEANLGLGCGNPQKIAEPQKGEIVVDLGCGRGMDVFLASKKVGNDGMAIGIDMTYDMLSRAREIAKKNDFKNVDFRLGEIENLPVGDNLADVVLSNCVINLSTDKQRVYDEIFRILKPGGRFGISDITLDIPLPNEVVEDPRMYGS